MKVIGIKYGYFKFSFIFPGEGGSRCDDLHRRAEQVDEGVAFHGAQLRACGRGMRADGVYTGEAGLR